MPSSFRWQVRSFSLTSKWRSRLSSRAIRSASAYFRTSSKAGPEMISGRPRLVDQDAVHLVDDRVVELSLALIFLGRLHVVAEVVEAELVVGAIGDVAAVDLLPLGRFHLRLDRPHGHSQTPEERAHPLGVAAGQVVVDRDDVHALAFERVEIGGQGGDQRLALAGDHLGDVAAVEDHPAHELDVEVPHVEEPPARLAAGGERLGQQVVERLPVGQPAAKLDRLRLQLLIRERLHRRARSR